MQPTFYKKNSIDLIVCVEAALHFNTRQYFFNEAFRVLKKGGVLVLTDATFLPERRKRYQWICHPNNEEQTIKEYHSLLWKFSEVTIESQTNKTWIPYYKQMLKWAMTENIKGDISKSDYQQMLNRSKATKSLPIIDYFFISSVKSN